MKLAARLIRWIERFLREAPPPLVGLGLLAAGVLGFVGMVTYNQTSYFCLKCHEPRGVFISFAPDDPSHTPYKRDGERCLACHTDKDFYVVAERWADGLGARFVHATNASPAELPDSETGYTDEQCLACHYDVLKLDEAVKLELPPKAAEIGLRFSHRRHFWVKDFPPEARARLTELNDTPAPTEDEKNEIDFLQRARLGWCGQCHDRVPPAGESIDRTINYFARNPMACTGCHADAVRPTHPGTIHLALPSEQTCARCHTGTFHGRFTVFRAQCDSQDQRDCRQCHPQWQPAAEDESQRAAAPATADKET